MSAYNAPPPIAPVKPSFVKRRWVQITGTAFIAFTMGTLASTSEPTAAVDKSSASTPATPVAPVVTAEPIRAEDQAAADAAKVAADRAQAATEAADKLAADKAAAKQAAEEKAAQKAAAKAAKAEREAAQNTIGGDGTYEIGVDMQPGTYRTAGPAAGSFVDSCYWERMSNLAGGFDAIIANDNISGPTTITIKPSDKAFQTNGCQDWVRR